MKCLLLSLLLLPQLSFAHGGKDHSINEGKVDKKTDTFQDAYKSINENYKSKVEAIFQSKCFDCHSDKTKYPWYYSVPGVNLIMNSHIKEAKSHLDMTGGFPFKSHETPREDLIELKKTIVMGSMPPWYYKPFHQDSEITSKEKEVILNWVETSLNKLGEKK